MANPLTLLMPVKLDTVPQNVLEMLETFRKDFSDVLPDIGTVHFSRAILLDRSEPNLQFNMANIDTPSDTLVIGIITSYDGAFDPYISAFADIARDPINALLDFVIGGDSIKPVEDNVADFTTFGKANDVSQNSPNEDSYSAYIQTVPQLLGLGATPAAPAAPAKTNKQRQHRPKAR